MTDPRALPDDRPNIGHDPLETEIAELQGEELPIDQDAILDTDEIEGDREPTLSEQEWGVPVDPDLRSGETDDPLVAIEEGQTYVPPSDPPLTLAPDDPEGIDSPGRDDIDAESDNNARVRDELRADAATTALADRLEIAVVGSTAILRGQVDGIEDSDALVEVASRVDGIEEVRDETEVPGL
ncbi:MAG: BON domain-containing protein [Chloroflexota bacterium]